MRMLYTHQLPLGTLGDILTRTSPQDASAFAAAAATAASVHMHHLLACSNPPNFAAGVSWPCTSGTTNSGASCKGNCTLGYAGGIGAFCKQGVWDIAGACEGKALLVQLLSADYVKGALYTAAHGRYIVDCACRCCGICCCHFLIRPYQLCATMAL
jgi:hypothetical protein